MVVVVVMVVFRFLLGAFFCGVATKLVTDPSPSEEVERTPSAFGKTVAHTITHRQLPALLGTVHQYLLQQPHSQATLFYPM